MDEKKGVTRGPLLPFSFVISLSASASDKDDFGNVLIREIVHPQSVKRHVQQNQDDCGQCDCRHLPCVPTAPGQNDGHNRKKRNHYCPEICIPTEKPNREVSSHAPDDNRKQNPFRSCLAALPVLVQQNPCQDKVGSRIQGGTHIRPPLT